MQKTTTIGRHRATYSSQAATRYENILRVEDGKLTQQIFVEPGWVTRFDPEDVRQSKDYCPMCNR